MLKLSSNSCQICLQQHLRTMLTMSTMYNKNDDKPLKMYPHIQQWSRKIHEFITCIVSTVIKMNITARRIAI